MSAAEVIEQIKALPPEEVALVREFLEGVGEPEAEKAFEEATERVFAKHDRVLRELAK